MPPAPSSRCNSKRGRTTQVQPLLPFLGWAPEKFQRFSRMITEKTTCSPGHGGGGKRKDKTPSSRRKKKKKKKNKNPPPKKKKKKKKKKK